MHFYTNKAPEKGTIVVANFDRHNELCVYVKLPEFNDIEGVIYNNELPKRAKLQKKTIDNMIFVKQIVCMVTKTPIMQNDGNISMIELSIRGVDEKYHSAIIARQRNIHRIHKLLDFITTKYNNNKHDMIHGLFGESVISPLIEIIDNNVDNYVDVYQKFLRDLYPFVSSSIIECKEDIVKDLDLMLKQKNPTILSPFDLCVWRGDKDGNDVIHVITSLFKYVKNLYPGIIIRYDSPPRYHIELNDVGNNSNANSDITNYIHNIVEQMRAWLNDNGVGGFDISFDKSKQTIIPGKISVKYQINML